MNKKNIGRDRSFSVPKLIGGITTVSVILISIITGWDQISPILFPNNKILSIPSYFLSLFVVFLVTFLTQKATADAFLRKTREEADALLRKTREEINRLTNRSTEKDLKIKVLRDELHELEKERLFDLITGVPNQEKLKLDIEKFAKDPKQTSGLQIILIDIFNFSYINDKHGFLKGDEIIRLIAQNIYDGIRRNEEMYKREIIGLDQENPLVNRMYRTYKGGDEFVFILRGRQFEAIGFLNRIHSQLAKLSESTKDILSGEKFNIKFHGAITQLKPSDNYDRAFDRVQKAFFRAIEHQNDLVVSWSEEEMDSDLLIDDEKLQSLAKRFYDIAKEKFSVQECQIE
jgi:GGDEF domain-containing protein